MGYYRKKKFKPQRNFFMRFLIKHWQMRCLLVDRVMMQKDNIVLVTGRRGDGKSTLALKIILGFRKIEELQERYNEFMNTGKPEEEWEEYTIKDFKEFDWEEDIAYTRKALQELCSKNKRSIILGDEAIVNAARRNAMTRANKVLHEVLTINRKNYNTIFFCLPSIEDFDISMLQYVSHWIHINDRGVASLFLPDNKSMFGKMSWNIDRMKKIYQEYQENNPKATNIPPYLFSNFKGYLRFTKLTAGVERKYLEIADRKKNQQQEEEEKEKEEKKTKTKKNLVDEETEKKLLEIADKLIKGKILDESDYYSYGAVLKMNREKMNREIGRRLLEKGEGRSPYRMIKEQQKERKKKESQKKKRVF